MSFPGPFTPWTRSELLSLVKLILPVLDGMRNVKVGWFLRHSPNGLVQLCRDAINAETAPQRQTDILGGSLALIGKWVHGVERTGVDGVALTVASVGNARIYVDREFVMLAAMGLGIKLAQPEEPATDAVVVSPTRH